MPTTVIAPMRVLIAEAEHALYAELLRQQAPEFELCSSDQPAELAEYAASCPLWLGQPDRKNTPLNSHH